MTKVIFRKFKDGEVIALFPQEPATRDGFTHYWDGNKFYND